MSRWLYFTLAIEFVQFVPKKVKIKGYLYVVNMIWWLFVPSFQLITPPETIKVWALLARYMMHM